METLLLPGMDGTGRLLASIHRHLEGELAPRIVGFPVDRPLGYEALLGEVSVPKGNFAIVAESFSGPLGVRLASAYPEQVSALVLVATFVRTPSLLVTAMSGLGAGAFRRPLPRFALRFALLGGDASDEDVDALQAALASVAPPVLAERLRAIAEVNVEREFASLNVPTLYLAGRQDRLVPRRTVAELKALRPDMEVRTLDAPHLILQRRPKEAAALIGAFVKASAARRLPA